MVNISYIFSLWTILIPLYQPACSTKVIAAGHILYHSIKESPTLTNPDIIKFYRQFDLQQLEQAIKVLDTFKDTYTAFCKSLQQFNEKTSLFALSYANFDKAAQLCREHDADLVEIRTHEDAQKVKHLLQAASYNQC